MTLQESTDLEQLKSKVQKLKLSTFDYLDHVTRCSETDLLHSGYRNKTRAEAMEMIFKSAQKEIEKLHKDYIKKYPD